MSEETDVMSLIRRIEAESSRAAKEALVEELAELELGRYAIQMAYDPFVTFGIRVGRRDEHYRPAFTLALTKDRLDTMLRKLADRTLTGNAAEAEIAEVMNVLTDDGAELLFRILSKDLKCGVGEATLNKVVPGIVPTFCVMRAHPFEEKRIKAWPVAIEPKLDGFRYTFIGRNGGGGFFTRSGKRAPSVDHLVKPMLEVAKIAAQNDPAMAWLLNADGHLDFVLDGEMMAGESFNETSGALRRESEEATAARFHIFDAMPWVDFDAVGSVGLSYKERRQWVERFVQIAETTAHAAVITKTPRYLCNSLSEITSYYDKFRSRGFEGGMVKNLDGLYDKKKSYGWLKLKNEDTEDLPIVGYFPGEPATKYENCLGGLIVKRGEVLVRIGGGFTDAERLAFWDQIAKDMALCDEALIERDGSAVYFPDVLSYSTAILFNLAEVEYHEVTPDGSLRHPRFVRLRDDKRGEIASKEAA